MIARGVAGAAEQAVQDRSEPERGSILALTLGALGVAALLVVVIAVASAVYLDRRDLLALTDATAAHAAAQVDPQAYAQGEVRITDRGVRAAARDFLAGAPPAVVGAPGLAIGAPTGVTPDGEAQVTLVALSRPAFLPWVLLPWSDGIALRATSTAGPP